jgi:hypothetical protein
MLTIKNMLNNMNVKILRTFHFVWKNIKELRVIY